MSRRAAIITICLLLALLLGSNLWWFYQFIDIGVTEKYHLILLDDRLRAMQAAHKVIPSLAADLQQEEVIRRVESALEDPLGTFEKEGWVVVGAISLRFDEAGHLSEVGPLWY